MSIGDVNQPTQPVLCYRHTSLFSARVHLRSVNYSTQSWIPLWDYTCSCYSTRFIRRLNLPSNYGQQFRNLKWNLCFLQPKINDVCSWTKLEIMVINFLLVNVQKRKLCFPTFSHHSVLTFLDFQVPSVFLCVFFSLSGEANRGSES